MEKAKEIFMKPLFWGITIGHLSLTLLGLLVSYYLMKNSK